MVIYGMIHWLPRMSLFSCPHHFMKKIKIHIYIYTHTFKQIYTVKCHFASKYVCALYLYMYIDIYSILFFSHIYIYLYIYIYAYATLFLYNIYSILGSAHGHVSGDLLKGHLRKWLFAKNFLPNRDVSGLMGYVLFNRCRRGAWQRFALRMSRCWFWAQFRTPLQPLRVEWLRLEMETPHKVRQLHH